MPTPPPNEQLGITIADGGSAALGSTADATSDNTLIGRIKNLLSRIPAALTASGNLKTALQEALPAGTNLLGKVGIDQTTPGTTNAVAVSTLPATPAGTNTIGGTFAIPSATHGATYAACPAATTTTAKASAGVLKALWIAGTGTAGTVTVTDGSTDLFAAGVPASVGTWSLPLPPEGATHATSVKITTAGAGVTAAAVYV